MFNLLTEREKSIFRREYSQRRTLAYFVGAVGIAFFSLALLLPVGIVAYSQQVATKAEYASVLAARGTAEQPDVADINRVNQLLSVLSVKEEVGTAEIVGSIINAQSSAISLTSIGYIRQDQILIQLQGVAANRDSLRVFARTLSQIPGFEVEELPISEFVKESNIPFTIRITFTPKP